MESPADTALRIGIPPERLENLIELPKVAKALVIARDNPNLAPEAIFAQLDLPVVDPDGLDLDRLELELDSMRRLGSRFDGSPRSVEQVQGGAIAIGRLEREKRVAEKRLDAIGHAYDLIGPSGGPMPAVTSVGAARKVLSDALAEAGVQV